MARPKSLKPTKNQLKAIRLTEEDLMKIKKLYGSLQKFIDVMVKMLPLIILISCGGGTGSTVSQNSEAGLAATTGELYAKADDVRKPYSLGYDLSYSCSGDSCSFTGELHHWNIASTFVTKAQINSGNLTKSGSVYTGIFYMASGQSFNVSVNIGQNFIKIDNGVNCTRTQITTTQSGYDAYLGGVANTSGTIAFNALTVGQCEI